MDVQLGKRNLSENQRSRSSSPDNSNKIPKQPKIRNQYLEKDSSLEKDSNDET